MSDAIERLRNRTRATVPARDNSLVKARNTESPDSTIHDLHNDKLTDFSHLVEAKVSGTIPVVEELSEEAEPVVIRRTVRLEGDVDEALEQLCRRERITRDVFIEATYLVCSSNPEILQEILAVAKTRYRKRKAQGEQRKFQTMEKKYRQQGD